MKNSLAILALTSTLLVGNAFADGLSTTTKKTIITTTTTTPASGDIVAAHQAAHQAALKAPAKPADCVDCDTPAVSTKTTVAKKKGKAPKKAAAKTM